MTSPAPGDLPQPSETTPQPVRPRLSVLAALIAVGGLYLALPAYLSVGPRWLPLTIIAVLSIPLVVSHQKRYDRFNTILGHTLSAILTLFMLLSIALLVVALPTEKEQPIALLRSAAALWFTNVLVFAIWYWRLDAGGPHIRDQRDKHEDGAFLFPQMTLNEVWSPHFIDYLFLAFNTSTAFSPTDAPVLSRWAKVLMMIQSTISLAVIALLAARAINILGPA
jgi:hypothetical protein